VKYYVIQKYKQHLVFMFHIDQSWYSVLLIAKLARCVMMRQAIVPRLIYL